jgi:hypothetical protein
MASIAGVYQSWLVRESFKPPTKSNGLLLHILGLSSNVSARTLDVIVDRSYHIHRLDLCCAWMLANGVWLLVKVELTLHLVLLFGGHCWGIVRSCYP